MSWLELAAWIVVILVLMSYIAIFHCDQLNRDLDRLRKFFSEIGKDGRNY